MHHMISLSPSRFAKVSVTRQKSELSYICVLSGINFVSFYNIYIGIWNCFDSVVYFFLFLFLSFLLMKEMLLNNIYIEFSVDIFQNTKESFHS